MSAAASAEKAELESLAARAGEVARRQATSAVVTRATEQFVADVALRFGSMGAHMPTDPHDELVFYRALTDAQLAVRAGDRRSVRVGLQRIVDALAQIIASLPVREGRDVQELARWAVETFSDVSRHRWRMC